MRQIKLNLLTDRYFLLGLIILLVNDFILKYTIGGLATGKLSDISGLFIFPFFWSIFFEKHKFKIYVLTTLIFIFWKCTLSTDFIDWINALVGINFSRVVDYSDFVALLVVPISYRHLNTQIKTYKPQNVRFKTVQILIATIS